MTIWDSEELEVERDTNVARLKTTTIFNFFEKPHVDISPAERPIGHGKKNMTGP